MLERLIRWTFNVLEVGFGIIGAGFFVVLYQVFDYLKNGDWLALSIVDGLIYLQKKPSDWLIYPESWIGVHKILANTALSVGLIILGVAWLIGFGYLYGSLCEYEERKESEAKLKRQEQIEAEQVRETDF